MNLKGPGDIPESLRKGVIIGVIILFIAGLFYFLYLPKIKEVRRIKTEIKRIGGEIKKAERIERNFQPPSQEEEQRWKEAEFRFYSLIPPKEYTPQLIYELVRRAKRYNILDLSLKSGKKVDANIFEGRKEVSPVTSIQATEIFGEDVDYFFVKLFFHSGYRDLAHFLEEIQDLDRFLEMESLVIKRDFPLISVEAVVKAYYRQEAGAKTLKEEER